MKTSKNEDHQKLRPPKNAKSADIYIASLLLVYLIFWHLDFVNVVDNTYLHTCIVVYLYTCIFAYLHIYAYVHMAEKAENVRLVNLSVTIQVKFEGILCPYRKSFLNKKCF